MKLYRVKVPVIARAVLESLCNDGSILVEPENRAEAENDLIAIMEEFLRRDHDLGEAVKSRMANQAIPYDQRGKVRGAIATEWNHPTGKEIPRYLARQIIENFMISRFVEDVFADDRDMYTKVVRIVEAHDVNEDALRLEAMERIKNVAEGSVEYEDALARAMREVKTRYGLISTRASR
jgi:hypothetical protein